MSLVLQGSFQAGVGRNVAARDHQSGDDVGFGAQAADRALYVPPAAGTVADPEHWVLLPPLPSGAARSWPSVAAS